MSFRTDRNTDRLANVGSESLDQNSAFPYQTSRRSNGLYITNNDPGNTLQISVETIISAISVGPFSIPPLGALNINLPEFNRIILDNSTTDFDIIVLCSSENFEV